jgi:hypothetical protein
MKRRDLELELQRQALADTRARIAAMEALLEELPGIFEAKFRERLQPLLDQQQLLLSQNSDLRQQLLLLQSSAPSKRRLRLLPLPGRRAEPAGQEALSPGDDGPPTAASAGPTHK